MKRDFRSLLLLAILAIAMYGILTVFKIGGAGNMITGGFISTNSQASLFWVPVILIILIAAIATYLCKHNQ